MNESEENKGWQGKNLSPNLLKDLRKYEAQYRTIVYENGMTLLYQRNFQIGAFALITFFPIKALMRLIHTYQHF